MGKLYRRKDRGDTWYADYFDRAGKRKHGISMRTADHQVAKARLRDLELATTDRATHPTEAFVESLKYFVDVVHASSPAGTVRCYRQKARHLAGALGDAKADSINREVVERYIAKRLAAGAHPHSVHKELVVLRGSLDSACSRGKFHGSADVVPPFSAQYEPRRRWLTTDQFAKLADHLVPPPRNNSRPDALARYERTKQNRILYCMLIAFGSPRVGELERMSWEDHVDLGRDVLQIPKGKTVGRPVAIHPLLRVWLEALREDSGPVLQPWSNVVRDLARACTRAGVPRVTPNDLRRTFASWLKNAGVDSMVVARLLGHGSTRMVDLVYGVLDQRTMVAAIAQIPGAGDARGTRGVPYRVAAGAPGTAQDPDMNADPVVESGVSDASVVPRDGVEPPTRGFSVLTEMAATITARRRARGRKLKSVG